MNIGRPSLAGKEGVWHRYVIKIMILRIRSKDCRDNECASGNFHQRMFRNVQIPSSRRGRVGNN
jgi:hypothetical protein